MQCRAEVPAHSHPANPIHNLIHGVLVDMFGDTCGRVLLVETMSGHMFVNKFVNVITWLGACPKRSAGNDKTHQPARRSSQKIQ
eukprot:15456271-Alexandrium_andersonii.AAC.1